MPRFVSARTGKRHFDEVREDTNHGADEGAGEKLKIES